MQQSVLVFTLLPARTRDSAEVGGQEVRAVVDCDQVGGHREDGEHVADDDLAVEAVQLGHAAVDHEGEGEEDAADQSEVSTAVRDQARAVIGHLTAPLTVFRSRSLATCSSRQLAAGAESSLTFLYTTCSRGPQF